MFSNLDLLINRLSHGRPPKFRDRNHMAFWILNKWRKTGKFCCIELHSDFDYVWDVWWVPVNGKEGHLNHKVQFSYDTLEEAIIQGALAAFKIANLDDVVKCAVTVDWDYDQKAIKNDPVLENLWNNSEDEAAFSV